MWQRDVSAVRKNKRWSALSNHALYLEAKNLLVKEYFKGVYQKDLDSIYDECELRSKNIFLYAIKDANILINSLENYKMELRVTDIMRIDFMDSLELKQLFNSVGAAPAYPIFDEIEDGKTQFETVFGNSTDTVLFCNVAGDSMLGDISDGDTVVVDKSLIPQHNQIVVVDLANNLLVKRLWIENGNMMFLSDNKDFPDYNAEEYPNFQIFGVVRQIIKKIL